MSHDRTLSNQIARLEKNVEGAIARDFELYIHNTQVALQIASLRTVGRLELFKA